MPASSGTLRTYGKRPRVKRNESSDGGETSKRRKVSRDPVIRTPSPSTTAEADTDTDVEIVEESSTPVKPKVSRTYGTPSAPLKLVRGLSGIFGSMSPSPPLPGFKSPAATPTKLAKRMLGRSKTESSVESPSSSVKGQHHQQGKGIDRTSSLPNLASSSSAQATPNRLSSNDDSNSTLSLSRPTIFPTSTSPATRTYAGKYRSFLVALPAASSGSTSKALTTEDEFETRESYSSLRSRWGVDNSEDDPHPSYDISSPNSTTTSEASPSRNGNGKGKAAIRTVPVPNGMMNPLKSISELRNKGEIRRFLDEVGYLFEGLDPKCGIALRRSSALEITTKLCDPEFARKAKAADFFGRTWELFLLAGAGRGEDKILDILLVFFLALIARDPVSLAELAERPTNDFFSESHHKRRQDTSLVEILIRILETISSENDLLILLDQNSRPSGGEDVKRPVVTILKKDRTILFSILKVITSKSNLFPPCTPISIPLLITSTLQTLPPSYLSASYLPTLLDSLRRCLSPRPASDTDTHASSPSTTTLYTALSSEPRWLEIIQCLPYSSVYHHLKLVDSYLVGQWTAIGHGTDPDREEVGHRYLERARDEWMVRDLVALGVCCELKARQEEKEGDDTNDDLLMTAHQKSFTLTLRVLISLTHDDKGWARVVLGCEMTMGLILRTVWKAGRELRCHARDVEGGSEDEEWKEENDSKEAERGGGSQAFDTMCLVLGLLTNLVQVVDDAKDVVRKSRFYPPCTMQNRACLKRCLCAQEPRKERERGKGKEREGEKEKERSGVEMLVWLYEQLQREREGGTQQRGNCHESTHLDDDHSQEQTREQENEAQTSFLCGHLSVLFGLLMMGRLGMENRGVILGPSGAGLVPRPTSRQPEPKRNRKGQRRQRKAVIEDEDQDEDEDEDDTPTTTVPTKVRLTKLTDQAREFGAFYTVVSRRITRMTYGHGCGYGFGRGGGLAAPASSCSGRGFVGGCDVATSGGVCIDADFGNGREEGEEGCNRVGDERERGGIVVVQRVVEFLEGLKDDIGG